jgi:hypothetical protein
MLPIRGSVIYGPAMEIVHANVIKNSILRWGYALSVYGVDQFQFSDCHLEKNGPYNCLILYESILSHTVACLAFVSNQCSTGANEITGIFADYGVWERSDRVCAKNRVNSPVGNVDGIESNNEVTFKNCYFDFSSCALATRPIGLVTLDFGVAVSAPSITPTCARRSGLSGGARAGIVIGSIALVIVVSVLAWCCILEKKNTRPTHGLLDDDG